MLRSRAAPQRFDPNTPEGALFLFSRGSPISQNIERLRKTTKDWTQLNDARRKSGYLGDYPTGGAQLLVLGIAASNATPELLAGLPASESIALMDAASAILRNTLASRPFVQSGTVPDIAQEMLETLVP